MGEALQHEVVHALRSGQQWRQFIAAAAAEQQRRRRAAALGQRRAEALDRTGRGLQRTPVDAIVGRGRPVAVAALRAQFDARGGRDDRNGGGFGGDRRKTFSRDR